MSVLSRHLFDIGGAGVRLVDGFSLKETKIRT